MTESYTELELELHRLAEEYVAKIHSRHLDPLKASTIKSETIDSLSRHFHEQFPTKILFMYANQQGETLKAKLKSGLKSNDPEELLIQAKVDILERTLRVKSVDYLKELVPFNTNIAQHALFSANPKKGVDPKGVTVEGVKSVHIKSKNGEVLTTYDARVMGAIQSLWFKQNDNSPVIKLKYMDLLNELGMTDGAKNYQRIQASLIRLKDIEVTLTQYQQSVDAEYEEIALTRLIDQIVFRRKVGTTDHFQRKFEIRLPEWLVQANANGTLFDVSLILMNDLKSYLAQGMYWLISSYTSEHAVKFELSTLASHFHFIDGGQPIMPVYKIVERITQACEELKQVGFIDNYEYSGKKQGLADRYLSVVKNPIFISAPLLIEEGPPKQIELDL
ncbi:replication initiator protein A [Paenibacillus crassostreae]|uniref:RepB family plasmid replication initiator protein n=1 Tax=Paenibacillus crassostreae TaxID=1763538 RepID=A0A167EK12_9BACL|nr:replication initiator protein A [Paenibacillus crassostreae]AOZ94937.1 RepB family plasmid replication initiator protein [Paenibacillus crassostreae]OAB75619.1 hypothetical protein PNBC_08300 [Paenibacillus crassostreae]